MYEDYIIKELLPFIDENYHTKDTERYIGGLSMGGFASLHLALTYPDLFSKVGGHSAAIREYINDGSGIAWLFKNGNSREEIDPLYQIEKLDHSNLEVYLDHGDMDHDWLQEGNQLLYEKLKDKGIEVHYNVESDGHHDYHYWSSQTEEYLLF